MAKKKPIYAEGEKPLTFKQAIKLAARTPHRTHKQIIEAKIKETKWKHDLTISTYNTVF